MVFGGSVIPASENRSLRYQKPTKCCSNGTPYCLPSTCQFSPNLPVVAEIHDFVASVMSATLPEVICEARSPAPQDW